MKTFLIIFLALIFSFLQIGLSFNFFINLPLLFFILVLFFYDSNNAFFAMAISGLFLDFFALNFGVYFLSFFIVFLILYYLHINVFANDHFLTYFWLNLIAFIVFKTVYYLHSLLSNLIGLGVYFFSWDNLWKDFTFGLMWTVICTLLIYILINAFFRKIKNKLIIIGE